MPKEGKITLFHHKLSPHLQCPPNNQFARLTLQFQRIVLMCPMPFKLGVRWDVKCEITLIDCNEKPRFPPNLTLNLDRKGYIDSILSNWNVNWAKWERPCKLDESLEWKSVNYRQKGDWQLVIQICFLFIAQPKKTFLEDRLALTHRVNKRKQDMY